MPRDPREGNEALFREINERIEAVGTTLAPDNVPLEFLCECDDTDCVEKVSVTRARSGWERFLPFPAESR